MTTRNNLKPFRRVVESEVTPEVTTKPAVLDFEASLEGIKGLIYSLENENIDLSLQNDRLHLEIEGLQTENEMLMWQMKLSYNDLKILTLERDALLKELELYQKPTIEEFVEMYDVEEQPIGDIRLKDDVKGKKNPNYVRHNQPKGYKHKSVICNQTGKEFKKVSDALRWVLKELDSDLHIEAIRGRFNKHLAGKLEDLYGYTFTKI